MVTLMTVFFSPAHPLINMQIRFDLSSNDLNQPFKDEAQTALFKDPVRTAL
jgi:hypothetical protein